MIDEEKLKEILKELSKPKKYEVGFVEARRIVSDGLSIIGKDATDILGFAKEANETRTRRVKGAQAWYKRMYEDGWRYAGNFEYEGLLNNGFVVMERELPNKRLQKLIESMTDEKTVIRTSSAMELDRGPELPGLLAVPGSFKEINPDAIQPLPEAFKNRGPELPKIEDEISDMSPVRKAYLKELESMKKLKANEGFEDEIADFIVDAQEGLKSLEQLFFDETGKNAVWKGKETKAFIQWKEDRD